MMKYLALLSLLALTSSAMTQIVHEYDTLTYNDRMNGSIDSLDISGSDLPTTFDGGASVLSPKGLSTNTLFEQYTRPQFAHLGSWSPMQFSALPHLGFSYSFGGQASQFLKAKYNHAFTDKTVLDLRYDRNSGEGVIRNSAFSTNDLKLQFQHRGHRYSARFFGEYTSNVVAHSGGLVTDTTIELAGLDFVVTNKGNAQSTNKVGQARLMNFFNLLPDSVNALGVVTNHHYTILNREYTESSDTLSELYPAIYIDSFSTRDQYNLATIRNGAGAYFSNPNFYIHGIVDYAYWEYQNLGSKYDTTELDVSSHMRLQLRGITLTNDLRFNIMGRFNEFSERAQLHYRSGTLEVNAGLLIESLAPSVQQRRYFANNSNYTMTSFGKQNWLRINGSAGYVSSNEKIKVNARGDFTSIQEVYTYNGSAWTRDSVTANFTSLGVNAQLQFGNLNIHPRFIYSFDQSGRLPAIQGYTRIFIKGFIFKAKKLEALVGIDASYISGFKTRSYIPSMDTYDWFASTGSFEPMTNLHAFLSLGIKDFRFFFRYENIGYFWSDKRNSVVQNYPVAGTRLRIGLTWDFFN